METLNQVGVVCDRDLSLLPNGSEQLLVSVEETRGPNNELPVQKDMARMDPANGDVPVGREAEAPGYGVRYGQLWEPKGAGIGKVAGDVRRFGVGQGRKGGVRGVFGEQAFVEVGAEAQPAIQNALEHALSPGERADEAPEGTGGPPYGA